MDYRMYDWQKIKILIEFNRFNIGIKYKDGNKGAIKKRVFRAILRKLTEKFNKIINSSKIDIDKITDETTYSDLLKSIPTAYIKQFEEYFGKTNARSNAVTYINQILKSENTNKKFLSDNKKEFHINIIKSIYEICDIPQNTLAIEDKDTFLNIIENIKEIGYLNIDNENSSIDISDSRVKEISKYNLYDNQSLQLNDISYSEIKNNMIIPKSITSNYIDSDDKLKKSTIIKGIGGSGKTVLAQNIAITYYDNKSLYIDVNEVQSRLTQDYIEQIIFISQLKKMIIIIDNINCSNQVLDISKCFYDTSQKYGVKIILVTDIKHYEYFTSKVFADAQTPSALSMISLTNNPQDKIIVREMIDSVINFYYSKNILKKDFTSLNIDNIYDEFGALIFYFKEALIRYQDFRNLKLDSIRANIVDSYFELLVDTNYMSRLILYLCTINGKVKFSSSIYNKIEMSLLIVLKKLNDKNIINIIDEDTYVTIIFPHKIITTLLLQDSSIVDVLSEILNTKIEYLDFETLKIIIDTIIKDTDIKADKKLLLINIMLQNNKYNVNKIITDYIFKEIIDIALEVQMSIPFEDKLIELYNEDTFSTSLNCIKYASFFILNKETNLSNHIINFVQNNPLENIALTLNISWHLNNFNNKELCNNILSNMIEDKNQFLIQFRNQILDAIFDFSIYFEQYDTLEYNQKDFYLLESIFELKFKPLNNIITNYLMSIICKKSEADKLLIFYITINLLYIRNNKLNILENIVQAYTKNISIDNIVAMLKQINIQHHLNIFKVLRFGYSKDLELKISTAMIVIMDSDENYFSNVIYRLIKNELRLFFFIYEVIINFMDNHSAKYLYLNQYQENIKSIIKKINLQNIFNTVCYEQSIILDDILNGYSTSYNEIRLIINQLNKSNLLAEHFNNISYKVHYMHYLRKLYKVDKTLFKIVFNKYKNFIFLYSKDIFCDNQSMTVYLYSSYIARAVKYKMVDQDLVIFIQSMSLNEFKNYLLLIEPISISKHSDKTINRLNVHLSLSMERIKYFKNNDLKYILYFFKKYRIEFYNEILKAKINL